MSSQNCAEQVVDLALKQATSEHATLNDDWRSLETKAQSCVAIASIMMAGLSIALDKFGPFKPVNQFFFCLASGFLLVASLCALKTMHVRTIGMPATASSALKQLAAIGLDKPGLQDRWINMQVDLARLYGKASEDMATKLENRSWWLTTAHQALAISSVSLFILIVRLASPGDP